jgi:hypothetical protein
MITDEKRKMRRPGGSSSQKEGAMCAKYVGVIGVILGMCILLSLGTRVSWAGDAAGGTAAAFLRINVSPRSSALGGAFAGLSGEASAAAMNPSCLAGISQTRICLMHNMWIEGVSHDYIGIVTPIGPNEVIGLSLVGTFTDLERRSSLAEPSSDHFFSYDAALVGSYGVKVRSWFSFGLSAKVIGQLIENERASGFAGDVGLQISPIREILTVGVVAQNIGPDMRLVEAEFPLPRTARVGLSSVSLQDRLTLVADYEFSEYGESWVHVGAEVNINPGYVRMGYKDTVESAADRCGRNGITGGLGIKYRGLEFDYAYIPISESLGNSSMFSLGIVF